MTRNTVLALALVAALGVAGTARTDVWDTATINDNGNQTRNEITHGFSQVHDLGAQPGPVADQDWYSIGQEPFSSYEILCDGHTGDISNGGSDTLQRVDAIGTVLQDSGDPSGAERNFRESLAMYSRLGMDSSTDASDVRSELGILLMSPPQRVCTCISM